MSQIVSIVLLSAILFNTAFASHADELELKMIRHESQEGDPGAQMLYGLAYLEGRYGLKVNPEKAVSWLKLSANAGNSYSQLLLGNCYVHGNGVNKDPGQAAQWWEKSADSGNAKAQYHLGEAFLHGTGVKQNNEKAIDWLTKSAEAGNHEAQYLIGKMYHEGFVVAQDHELAKDWLSRAASNGHTGAINLLAIINSMVKYTTMVSQQSYDVLAAKAKQGDPHAQYELGLRYKTGALDVIADPGKSLYWLTKAADNGNLQAMKTLSDIYSQGLLNVKKDPEKAAFWLGRSSGRR